MERAPSIEITADGSATLRSAVFAGADGPGDTYHSLRGAVGEARHVFIETGFLAVAGGDCGDHAPLRVLEIGFGTGLNAWLTLSETARTGRSVEYTAMELYPVPEDVAARLNYTDDAMFMTLHTAPWGGRCRITDGFVLRKLKGDATELLAGKELLVNFDVVYWDAFAPDTQAELWTEELFARVFEAMAPGGALVTYSAKGSVRRALKAVGFEVEKLPGALGKRHMLRALREA